MVSAAVTVGSATLVAVSCNVILSSAGKATDGLRIVGSEIVTPGGPSTIDHSTLTAPPAGFEAVPANIVDVASGSDWSGPASMFKAPRT